MKWFVAQLLFRVTLCMTFNLKQRRFRWNYSFQFYSTDFLKLILSLDHTNNFFLNNTEKQVLTAVKTTMLFCAVTLCELVGRYRRFGETYCLHIQVWRRRLSQRKLKLWETVRLFRVTTDAQQPFNATVCDFQFKRTKFSIKRWLPVL